MVKRILFLQVKSKLKKPSKVFSYLGSNLVSALACLQMHDLPHGAGGLLWWLTCWGLGVNCQLQRTFVVRCCECGNPPPSVTLLHFARFMAFLKCIHWSSCIRTHPCGMNSWLFHRIRLNWFSVPLIERSLLKGFLRMRLDFVNQYGCSRWSDVWESE